MKEIIECIIVEEHEDMAKARVKMHGECSSCGLCEGSNAVYYEAVNQIGAKCGQSVLLEIEKQNVLKIAFIVFMLPLLTVAAGIYCGYSFGPYFRLPSSLSAGIFGIFALAITIFIIKKFDSKVQNKSTTPIITKILS